MSQHPYSVRIEPGVRYTQSKLKKTCCDVCVNTEKQTILPLPHLTFIAM